MIDTSAEMQARYHAMLLARSGEERLRMAGSMYAAARALAVASIRASDPAATEVEIRQALFRRFYGHEFDEQTRSDILARIARDAAGESRPEQLPAPPLRNVAVAEQRTPGR